MWMRQTGSCIIPGRTFPPLARELWCLRHLASARDRYGAEPEPALRVTQPPPFLRPLRVSARAPWAVAVRAAAPAAAAAHVACSFSWSLHTALAAAGFLGRLRGLLTPRLRLLLGMMGAWARAVLQRPFEPCACGAVFLTGWLGAPQCRTPLCCKRVPARMNGPGWRVRAHSACGAWVGAAIGARLLTACM